ncbi:hypothetical protein ELOC111193_17905 [Elizabethkingia occulta]
MIYKMKAKLYKYVKVIDYLLKSYLKSTLQAVYNSFNSVINV